MSNISQTCPGKWLSDGNGPAENQEKQAYRLDIRGKRIFIDNTSRTHTDVLRLCIGPLRHSIWRMDMIAGKSIYCLAPRRYNHKAK